ncbi:hypothetical protein SUGI_0234650 [Cryptomeria japonica]|nr:hypothetical protein SUGI_0234650 [Cryptomeria japonica]
MGTSGKTTQGQTKPGYGDPIFALTIGTLGQAKKDALTFEELPPSLSDPIFINCIEFHTIDWQPNFNTRMYVLPNNKVWIRLYNCPLDYWHIDVIKDICKELGTFVSTDDILEDKIWGSFLKICISMDQITKIPDEVIIIGAGKISIQKIDREDQMHICLMLFLRSYREAICNNTLDNENVPLTEATPLIIIPPSSGECESQQDLLTLLEKTKTL